MNRKDGGLTTLAARLDGIGHVLRDRRLEVPRYQRSYSWTIEQVETFWTDLRAASLLPTPDYFLGTLVVSSEEGARKGVVIDGQQRLATTALLLSALRDEFRDAGESARCQAFQSEYLSFMDLSRGSSLPRLQLNKHDNVVFESIALGQEPLPPAMHASTHRLLEAYAYLKAEVHGEVVAAKQGWRERLIAWSDFLEVHARVIVLDVPSAADAFLIFETLNDRGVALSVADLLKNFLYGAAESEIDEVEACWDRVASALDFGGDEQLILDYLRHFWSSGFGATRERELYRSFRSRIRSPQQAVAVASNLAHSSVNYLALLTGDPELWPGGAVSKSEAETFTLLGLSQNRPLMLAAMDSFGATELPRLVKSMIAWSVRGLLVGGIGGGTTEKYYCDVAVRIRAGKVQNCEHVFEALAPIIPSDEQFHAAVSLTSAPSSRLTRYLLLAYENFLRGKPNPAIIDGNDYATAGYQRIVSRAEYSQDPGGTEWTSQLGNVALVSRSQRAAAGKDWDQVRNVLAAQPYVSSQTVSGFPYWHDALVAERQAQIANAALAIWPRVTNHASA